MERLLQQQNKILESHGRDLARIEEHAGHDKLLQAAQLYATYKTLKDSDKIVAEIDELTEETKKGLTSVEGNGLNSNVIKLTDTLRMSLNLRRRGVADPISSTVTPAAEILPVADEQFTSVTSRSRSFAESLQYALGRVRQELTLDKVFSFNENSFVGSLITGLRSRQSSIDRQTVDVIPTTSTDQPEAPSERRSAVLTAQEEEIEAENLRMMEGQNNTLSQIEENTRPLLELGKHFEDLKKSIEGAVGAIPTGGDSTSIIPVGPPGGLSQGPRTAPRSGPRPGRAARFATAGRTALGFGLRATPAAIVGGALYGATQWAESASIHSDEGEMTGTGRFLDAAQRAVGGRGLTPETELSTVERITADADTGWSDVFGSRHRANQARYANIVARGGKFTREEADALTKYFNIIVPPNQIREIGSQEDVIREELSLVEQDQVIMSQVNQLTQSINAFDDMIERMPEQADHFRTQQAVLIAQRENLLSTLSTVTEDTPVVRTQQTTPVVDVDDREATLERLRQQYQAAELTIRAAQAELAELEQIDAPKVRKEEGFNGFDFDGQPIMVFEDPVLRGRVEQLRQNISNAHRSSEDAVVELKRFDRITPPDENMDRRGRITPSIVNSVRAIEALKTRFGYTEEELQRYAGGPTSDNFISVNGRRYNPSVIGLYNTHIQQELEQPILTTPPQVPEPVTPENRPHSLRSDVFNVFEEGVSTQTPEDIRISNIMKETREWEDAEYERLIASGVSERSAEQSAALRARLRYNEAMERFREERPTIAAPESTPQVSQTGDVLYQQSSENLRAATQMSAQSQPPTVINAPQTNVVNNSNFAAPKIARNPESSYQQYNNSRFNFGTP